ncbi:peptidoglycan DD-metalloendopeptidase family protein [Chrysosporum bergii ANA360D]|uniref:Peptidoglycan DD-metalloendopeptidase family protein n=1 Tax=Chrysosporum bergii ANA360D TaxID=617107 RepID=A0AA43GNM4_9CYAN|nr:M23 family metallopeptidase [Chrysosporum bergii]MDH6059048.1 peptidoglycan DD-metalloendopeptidase family protein [Chrysosporum bergii ANA360D]
MTQRHQSTHHHFQNSSKRYPYGKLFHIYVSTLPAQSFFLLSSVSFLGGGLAVAQTETAIDNIVPAVPAVPTVPVVETSQSTAVGNNPVKKNTDTSAISTPESDLEERQADLIQKLRSRKPVSPPKANVTLEKPRIQVAQPTKPSTLPEKLPEVARPGNTNRVTSTTVEKTKDYNNAYIDPINYNVNTTATYQAPKSVVLTERSSGCETVLPSGQSISSNTCAGAPQTPAPNQSLANSEGKTTPNWLKASQNTQVAKVATVTPLATKKSNNTWRPQTTASSNTTKTAYRPNRFIPQPGDFATTTAIGSPMASNGETLPPPMASGNIAPRASRVAYDFPLASVLPQIPFTGGFAYANHRGMMFPLSIPARITSVFGWRIHPITGDRRFHAGTDLGAPMGTPVVAAAAGEVETANWLGGYGLTVILNHPSAQQTLYGHLSELFVQPGQRVEKGTVIGRVGSTGNSTGPHLHFEVRHLNPQGWVAVDSGVQLQVALNQLVQALQTARVSQQPDS